MKAIPGEYRLLHNLSYPYNDTSINVSIPESQKHVKYACMQDAIDHILRTGMGAFLVKTNIKSTFRLIPVSPADYHLLGVQLNGKYYFDKVTAMGYASSCRIFERFASTLEWIAREKFGVTKIMHFLDDFLIIASNLAGARYHLTVFLRKLWAQS